MKMNKEKVIYWSKYALVLLAGVVLGFVIKGKLTGQAPMGYGAAGQATVLTKTKKKARTRRALWGKSTDFLYFTRLIPNFLVFS